MRFLTSTSFGGIVVTSLLIVELYGADVPVRFRSQGMRTGWGGWDGGDASGHDGWGGGGSLLFSPDSKLLVRQLDDSTLVLWRLAEKRELATLPHDGWVRFGRFSPDSRMLLVAVDKANGGGKDSEIVLWDLEPQKIILRLEEGRVCLDAEFSRDGHEIVTSTGKRHRKDGSPTNKIVVWETAKGEELARLKTEQRGREHRPNSARLNFSPDGKWLLTSTSDGAAIWDTVGWNRVRLLPGSSGTWPAVFSPDSRFVFSACQNRSSNVPLGVRVWNVETGKTVATTTFDISKEQQGGCWFTLAPDGRSLVTSAEIHDHPSGHHRRLIMKHWNVVSGQETVLQMASGQGIEQHFLPWECSGARFSPDGETLALVPWQPRPQVNLLDTKFWQTQRSLDMTLPEDDKVPGGWWGHQGGLQFSPDGHWLVAARHVARSREQEVFLWELNMDGKRLANRESDR